MKKYNFHELRSRSESGGTLPVDVNESIEKLCARFQSDHVNEGLKDIKNHKRYGSFEIIDKSKIRVAYCKKYACGIIPSICIVRNLDELPFLEKKYFFVNMISELNEKVGMGKGHNEKA